MSGTSNVMLWRLPPLTTLAAALTTWQPGIGNRFLSLIYLQPGFLYGQAGQGVCVCTLPTGRMPQESSL